VKDRGRYLNVGVKPTLLSLPLLPFPSSLPFPSFSLPLPLPPFIPSPPPFSFHSLSLLSLPLEVGPL